VVIIGRLGRQMVARRHTPGRWYRRTTPGAGTMATGLAYLILRCVIGCIRCVMNVPVDAWRRSGMPERPQEPRRLLPLRAQPKRRRPARRHRARCGPRPCPRYCLRRGLTRMRFGRRCERVAVREGHSAAAAEDADQRVLRVAANPDQQGTSASPRSRRSPATQYLLAI
jgi:hypothetical protein